MLPLQLFSPPAESSAFLTYNARLYDFSGFVFSTVHGDSLNNKTVYCHSLGLSTFVQVVIVII